jgi:hypothetical protein
MLGGAWYLLWLILGRPNPTLGLGFWGWVSPSCLLQRSVLLQVGNCGCYFCLPLNSILAPSGGLCHGTLLHNHQCEL